MGEIPIYTRTATSGFRPLPKPQGVPALPKPPYELADRSGERRFAGVVGDISQNLFYKIINVQAENEYHSFIGSAHEREQQFYNLINEKPDMPLNEMLIERDNMIKDIRTYHSKLKLPRSRQESANWIASNLGTLKERTEAEAYNVSAKYSQQLLNIYEDYYIQNMMPNEYANLIEGHIKTGTIREGIGRIRLELGLAKIKELQKEQLRSVVLDIATSYKNEKDEIDIDEGDKFIERQPIPREEKIWLKDKLHTASKQEEYNKERAWEAIQGKWDSELDKLFREHRYDVGIEYIETVDSGLKGEYASKQLDWKTQKRKLFEGALKGDVALNISEYAKMSRRIQTANTDEEFEQIVKEISEGTGKLWNAEKAKQLIDNVSMFRKPDSPLKTPTAKLYLDALEAYKKAEVSPKDPKELLDYDTKLNKLINFFKNKPDATPEEASEFYKTLMGIKDGSAFWRFIKRGGWAGDVYRWWRKGEAWPETEKVNFEESVKFQTAPYVELDNSWGKLSADQKQKIWRAFENGYTAEEIIAALGIE